MRDPHAVWIVRDMDSGKEVHTDCIVCLHCNNLFEIPDGMQPKYFCPSCKSTLCQSCYDEFTTGPDGCVPYMKKIEAAEEAQYRRTNFMKMAGID